MLIGILSDTHNARPAMLAAVRLLAERGARHFLHCGDVGEPHMLDALAGLEAGFVWGNNDYDRTSLSRYAADIGVRCFGTLGQLELDARHIAITHGDDSRLVRRLLDEQGHDYLLVGHSHVPRSDRIGRTRLINPGALYRARTKTVALLETSSDNVTFLTIEV